MFFGITIIIDEINQKSTINATVFVCDKTTQESLNTEFEMYLQTDYIDTGNTFSELGIDPSTFSADVYRISDGDDNKTASITTTIESTANNPATLGKEQDSYTVIIIISASALMVILTAAGFIYLTKKNRNLKKELNMMKATVNRRTATNTDGTNNTEMEIEATIKKQSTLTVTEVESRKDTVSNASSISDVDIITAGNFTDFNAVNITTGYGNQKDNHGMENKLEEGHNGDEMDYLSDGEDGDSIYGRGDDMNNRKVTDNGYVTDGYDSAGGDV